MRKSILMLTVVLIVVMACGCTTYPSETNKINYVASDGNLEVSPNWTFIDLNDIPGDVGLNSGAIGNAILQWELSNPDREIVSMEIIYAQYASGASEEIQGISIYSKLK